MEQFDVLNESGGYSGEVKTRDECHHLGLWHKAVVVFIIASDNKKVLLQKRSANKKMWPNLWDITAGGHVLTNELGWECVIRETEEEIGINLQKEDLEFIGATISQKCQKDITDKHFNEYYIVHKDLDIKNIVLQKEEVQEIKWFPVKEIAKRVKDNFNELTTKEECWYYLLKYIDIMNNKGEK